MSVQGIPSVGTGIRAPRLGRPVRRNRVRYALTVLAFLLPSAIPLTLFAKALLIDVDPAARWLRPLISNKEDPETAPDG